ncbi:hypothetical protein BV22DRAFT_856880 [Leucogyrophana mollusca]|uniref:Uncharacterized protein n=1 Tax=Leucogyrophana mollusca TaxID=85980 RepID=A0ACB8B176_9AGAM|nr:hypothetical protein BV22DRAFT_856880 [Leucogyrophana mollusca]
MLTVLPTDGTITATAECAASSIAEIQKEEQERKQRNERLLKFAKTFGSIPGVEVGDTWSSRAECPVHRVPMQGIHGSKDDGCYSIAISNLYKYDSDFGETVIYTGSGGFEHYDPKSGKRRRTGPQVRDQQWSDFGNMSLYVSRETGNPVRVIRSWKTVSKYAPAFGYRYDGLYTVKDAWKEQTENGFKICRYRLEVSKASRLVSCPMKARIFL